MLLLLCRTKIAYKVLGSNNLGTERRRSLLASNSSSKAAPKELGSGVWSWWNDDNAASIGSSHTVSGVSASPTVDSCLMACNDDSECAAVIFSFASIDPLPATLATTDACRFRKGEVTVPSAADDSGKHSMIRYRISYPTTGTTVKPF
jgi:hypothetical protein